MTTLRVIERKYGKHKGWYVMHQRDELSGPWKDYKTASDTRTEWTFGTNRVLSLVEEQMSRRLAKRGEDLCQK
jgi:hypothetical protein